MTQPEPVERQTSETSEVCKAGYGRAALKKASRCTRPSHCLDAPGHVKQMRACTPKLRLSLSCEGKAPSLRGFYLAVQGVPCLFRLGGIWWHVHMCSNTSRGLPVEQVTLASGKEAL